MFKTIRLTLVAALIVPTALRADHLSFCYDTYPPFAIENWDAPATGVMVSLLEEVVDRIDGVTADVTLLPWKRCQQETAAGGFDGILPLFPNEDRKAYMSFTQETLSEVSVLWYKNSRFPDGLSWDGDAEPLAHLRLGMVIGCFINQDMEDTFRARGEITRARDVESLMRLLMEERIDLVANNAAVGKYVLNSNGWASDAALIERPISSRYMRFGLSKVTGADRHIAAFDRAISELAAEGVLERLSTGEGF